MTLLKILLALFLLCSASVLYAQGDTVWVRNYNGSGNGSDEAAALALDDSGNVYVAGSAQSSISLDFAIIKYDSSGNILWVKNYNGPLSGDDQALHLERDSAGYIYVSGRSEGTSQDLATIKYAPSGDTVWVRRYNGPFNAEDQVNDLALDQDGNVYLTGYREDSISQEETNFNFLTLKYSPSGTLLWQKIFDRSGSLLDFGNALAVDDSGYVYVTGGSSAPASGEDFTTIKYNSNGDTVWVRHYNGPGNSTDEAQAILLDGKGHIYVTGQSVGSGTSDDFATIKYNQNGDTLWVRRYNGLGNGADRPVVLNLDDSGYVYVTGYTWNGTSSDYTTIKYDSVGNSLWVRTYNGPGNSTDQALAQTLDESGWVYSTGFSIGSGTGEDFATVNYSVNGVIQGVRRYNGLASGNDRALDVAVDQEYIYVTGRSRVGGTDDITTIKYFKNRPPVLSVPKAKSGLRNTQILLPVLGLDPDGITPALSAFGYPSNSSFFDSLNGKGTLSFTPTSAQVGVHSNITFVATDGLLADTATSEIHVFIRQDTLSIFAFSPVNLVVSDPKSDSIGVGFNSILENSDYDTTQDLNNDGKKDEVVTILTPYLGEYDVRVIPTDTGRFTLQYILNSNSPTVLANNLSITDPDTTFSYQFKILETLRGDPNRDGKQSILDVVFLVNFVFKGGPEPFPYTLGNINCDFTSGGVDIINIVDVIAVVNFVFRGGKAPCS